ncbi:hypothetical protein F4775DRAFT_221197 [Biscogniauxia sp. FL1348]|nr:hypothetical protein F4775DRAFT_221197 [Biscogniauxia sp. FL1348]
MASSTYSPEYLAESRTVLLNALYSVPIPLEVLSTVFRLWVQKRHVSGSRYHFEDYLIVWATISAVAVCVVGLIFGAPNGLGRHRQAVSDEDFAAFLMGDYIFSHFYNVAIASTKLSVLALYYRVLVTRMFRRVVLATAVFVALWLVTMELLTGFGCRPVQTWWGATEGTCVDKVAFTYFTNITNLATDLWIFAMPIPVILRLKVQLDKRLCLCLLFSIGLGTCAISAARLSFVFSVASDDVTWREVPLGILSAWEPCGGILCANLPIMYRYLVEKFQGVSTSTGGFSQHNGSGIRGSHAYAKDNGYSDWIPLNESGGLSSDIQHQVTGARADDFPPRVIMVERSFTQDVHHSGDEKTNRSDSP